MFEIKSDGALVVGASAGGIHALRIVLGALPSAFAVPVFVVQHFPVNTAMFLPTLLAEGCALPITEAEDKASVQSGHVYIAAPGYHLLIEMDGTMALSADEVVNCSRPSIDVLFESAARVYGEALVGILLTGANNDGAQGIKTVRALGGYTIVEDPATAEAAAMPLAALNATPVDVVAPLDEIARLLASCKVRNHDQ